MCHPPLRQAAFCNACFVFPSRFFFFSQVASGGLKRRIQLTGFRGREKKALVELLFKLDCVFLDNKVLFLEAPWFLGLKQERKKNMKPLKSRTLLQFRVVYK